MAAALLVGLGLGVALHRGDFCMHSAFREALAGHAGPAGRAYLLALALQLGTVNGLAAWGLLRVPVPPVAVLGAAVGGAVFGVGMILAKG